MEASNLKVFQIAEYEWWYGASLDAVYRAAEEDTGVPREEWEKEFKAREVTQEEMDKPDTCEIQNDGEPVELGSMRDALELCACVRDAGMLCSKEN